MDLSPRGVGRSARTSQGGGTLSRLKRLDFYPKARDSARVAHTAPLTRRTPAGKRGLLHAHRERRRGDAHRSMLHDSAVSVRAPCVPCAAARHLAAAEARALRRIQGCTCRCARSTSWMWTRHAARRSKSTCVRRRGVARAVCPLRRSGCLAAPCGASDALSPRAHRSAAAPPRSQLRAARCHAAPTSTRCGQPDAPRTAPHLASWTSRCRTWRARC